MFADLKLYNNFIRGVFDRDNLPVKPCYREKFCNKFRLFNRLLIRWCT